MQIKEWLFRDFRVKGWLVPAPIVWIVLLVLALLAVWRAHG